MDVEEYWDSRVMGSKHGNYHHFPPARLDSSDVHLVFDDSDGDDDSQACFPCPYCYVDIELRSLCMHLQEEHCFDVKNAVCPVCAANLGRDMIGHFMIQHSHLIKRRKPKKSGLRANNSTPIMGRDLQELTSFLGVRSTSNRENAPDFTPDPLLSPFISNVSIPVATVNQEANLNFPSGRASATPDIKSKVVATNEKDPGQNTLEKIQRAEFVQQLLLSTIF